MSRPSPSCHLVRTCELTFQHKTMMFLKLLRTIKLYYIEYHSTNNTLSKFIIARSQLIFRQRWEPLIVDNMENRAGNALVYSASWKIVVGH